MMVVFAWVRIVAAFSLFYLLLPTLLVRWCARSRDEPVVDSVVRAFIATTFVFEAGILFLGSRGLCLPGSVFGGYAILAGAVITGCHQGGWNLKAATTARFLNIVTWLESDGSMHALTTYILRRLVRHRPTPQVWTFLALGMLTLLNRSWFALHNFRFAQLETYSHVLSLQMLVHAQKWAPDGFVPLFAPLVFLSGFDGGTVMRLALPLFAALVPAAAAWCAWRWSHRADSAFLAAAICAAANVVVNRDVLGEIPRSGIEACFLSLAVGMLPGRQWAFSAAAAACGMMIRFPPGRGTLIALGSVLAGMALGKISTLRVESARSILVRAAVMGATACILGRVEVAPERWPVQYEAAARIIWRISHQFPRNKWVVVSPVHELVYSFGKGWHVELAEFVSKYTPEQVESPEFQFSYQSPDVFLFLEKEPLLPSDPEGNRTLLQVVDLTHSTDPTVLAYSNALGRAGLEYQTAELVAAYARGHHDLSVYYQDEKLAVYHLRHAAELTRQRPDQSLQR